MEKPVWDRAQFLLKELDQEIPGIFNWVFANNLGHYDVTHQRVITIRERLGTLKADRVLAVVGRAYNEQYDLHPGDIGYLASPDDVHDLVLYHEYLHEELSEDHWVQEVRDILESSAVFGKTLTPDHPFIRALKKLHGEPHLEEYLDPQNSDDIVNWHLEEHLILSVQQEEKFPTAKSPNDLLAEQFPQFVNFTRAARNSRSVVYQAFHPVTLTIRSNFIGEPIRDGLKNRPLIIRHSESGLILLRDLVKLAPKLYDSREDNPEWAYLINGNAMPTTDSNHSLISGQTVEVVKLNRNRDAKWRAEHFTWAANGPVVKILQEHNSTLDLKFIGVVQDYLTRTLTVEQALKRLERFLRDLIHRKLLLASGQLIFQWGTYGADDFFEKMPQLPKPVQEVLADVLLDTGIRVLDPSFYFDYPEGASGAEIYKISISNPDTYDDYVGIRIQKNPKGSSSRYSVFLSRSSYELGEPIYIKSAGGLIPAIREILNRIHRLPFWKIWIETAQSRLLPIVLERDA